MSKNVRISKILVSILSILNLLVAYPVSAAITPGNVNSFMLSASPGVVAHTVSATSTSPYLLVGFLAASTDLVSSVTANGAAMTLFKKLQNNNGLGRWMYLYGVVPTSTGNVSVVMTAPTTDILWGSIWSYGGVLSNGNTTGTNPDALRTSVTLTTSSTVSAARIAGMFYSDGGDNTPGAATTLRSVVTSGLNAVDSTIDLGVAGSYSLVATMPSGHSTFLEGVLNPAPVSAASPPLPNPISINAGVAFSAGGMGI